MKKLTAKKAAAKKVPTLPQSDRLLAGRSMYLWKLRPVLDAEGGIDGMVARAGRAKLSSVWIKIAEGVGEYQNVTGTNRQAMVDTVKALADAGVSVWGWHVPKCESMTSAREEAGLCARLAVDFNLDGVLMDAEAGSAFFRGTSATAEEYASKLRLGLNGEGKAVGISSHDIPDNFPNFPFDSFARHAQVNAPQVYYGGSPSVSNRLGRAIDANNHLAIPFIPVGAGWIGSDGGCSSASACAEKAVTFMNLVRQNNFQGYSFWHWFGAPTALWLTLFESDV